MGTLLVAFDGSDCALRALRHAIQVARDGSKKLLVVNAHERAVMTGELAQVITAEQLAEYDRKESEKVLDGAEAVLKTSGVPYQRESLFGQLGKAIADRAAEVKAEGIVMGTHGRSALGTLFAGSVAQKVLHHATVPVTLVK